MATTTTANNAAGGGADGEYLFAGLTAGDYFLVFTTPAGYAISTADQGGDDTLDTDLDITNGRTAVTTLTAGESDMTWDAGYHLVASIGNYVWTDTDADGVLDGGEAGLNGVTVSLYTDADADGIAEPGADDGVATATTTTANNAAGGGLDGEYLFNNLRTGDYFVVFTLPASTNFSAQDQGGDDTVDSDANTGTGATIVTTLSPNEADFTWDAGMYQNATIGDKIWIDTDADGIQDGGETAGLNGVTVSLYSDVDVDGNAEPGADDGAAVATTTTANNAAGGGNDGEYQFTGVTPGNYFVVVTEPAGYDFSSLDQGADDTVDSDVNTTTGVSAITTLSSGETDATWDAGVYQLATIGDRVWIDADGDGVLDGGEVGLNGVTVNLYIDLDLDGMVEPGADDGAAVATTTTANNAAGGGNDGEYQFTGLIPSSYYVQIVAPGGYTISTPDQGGDDTLDSDVATATGLSPIYQLSSNETDATVDAGMYQPATIGDKVWIDTDADGIQDGGETAGLNGVTVSLYLDADLDGIAEPGADDGAATTTTTTANNAAGGGNDGEYQFTNLNPGNYFIVVTEPATYDFSPQDQGGNDTLDSDVNTTTGNAAVTTLVSGESETNWDAGVYQTATIGNYVWTDSDADGILDGGEAGLNGVTVSLYSDVDADGIAEPGTDDGAATTTTTTANNAAGGGLDGEYQFANLVPGNYFVVFTEPATYDFSPQDQGGDDTVDSDANTATGVTAVTALTSGESDATWDAGLYQTATIGNFVWTDSDADGILDGGETGLNGVTVSLYSDVDADGIAEPGTDDGAAVASTTTANNAAGGGLDGEYQFASLVPGNYFILVAEPATYDFSAQDQGGDDTVDSDVNTTTGVTAITALTSGESDATWDAGVYQLASIGDYVWIDTDIDGIQDGGEVGLNGVTVNLYIDLDQDGIVEPGADDGAAVATTTTANNAAGGGNDGEYLFSNLVPGSYYIDVILPANYAFSSLDQGGDDSLDSDTATATGLSGLYQLSSNENERTLDSGIYELATLGNFVWVDADRDGIQDGGETGYDGATVSLYADADLDGIAEPGGDDGAAVQTDTTAGGGIYGFSNVVPGNYFIQVTLPATYLFSAIDQGGDDTLDSDVDTTTGNSIVFTLTNGQTDVTWDAAIRQDPDLEVDKVAEGSDADAVGSDYEVISLDTDYTYTITVTNNGPISGTNIFLTDLVPSGVTVSAAVPTQGTVTTGLPLTGANPNGSPLVWDIGTLTAAQTVTLTLTAQVTTANLGDFTAGVSSGSNQNYAHITAMTEPDSDSTVNNIVLPFVPGTSEDDEDDARVYVPPALGDFVWVDLDRDGIQDGGETGLSGVTVDVYEDVDSSGTINGGDTQTTATTNAAGAWTVGSLNVATYLVQFTTPANYNITLQDQGGDDTVDSDGDGTGTTGTYALTSGAEIYTVDMGYYPDLSLGNLVFGDLDNDGIFESGDGEVGIDGVDVQLYVDTNADGDYDAGTDTLQATQTTAGGGFIPV